jgi:hypothetical protein
MEVLPLDKHYKKEENMVDRNFRNVMYYLLFSEVSCNEEMSFGSFGGGSAGYR